MATPTGRDRCHGDRGVALLELAMVLPFLALLAFGSIELSRAWVSQSRVASAVGAAARVGAADGSRVQSDRDILLALEVALPSDLLASTDRVVIYRSTDPAGAVPAGCIKARGDPSEIGSALCNTYNGATLRSVSATSMTGFGGTVGTKDVYWPPIGRNDVLAAPPDYLGVWVRTRGSTVTGILHAGSLTITARSVVRLQPDLNG